MMHAGAEAGGADLVHELGLLFRSRYPLVTVEGADERRIQRLVARAAAAVGATFLQWSSTVGLERPGVGLPIEGTADPVTALRAVFAMEVDVLVLFRDLHPYFERPEVLRLLRESEPGKTRHRRTLVLSGLSVVLPPELSPLSARLEVRLPGLAELLDLVRSTARELAAQRRTVVELTAEEIEEAASSLIGLHREEARRVLYQAALDDGRFAADDLPRLRDSRRRRLEQGSHLQWVESLPGLSAMGGAPNLRKWAGKRSEAFTEAARLFGVEPPRGLLLVGVPGTGKSLACRALAGEWTLPLLRLDPSNLYDKFVGQTESNLRAALAAAEALAPAVLWIDEIEKALATGHDSADGGLSGRVLGSLLSWLQERRAAVFVMATSNDVTRLPVELLRRGRFDEVFFVDLPSLQERLSIFSIHLERRGRRAERFDLETLAELSDGFSGAEIEGVVVAGLYHAFSLRQELTSEVLAREIEATRPLSRLRPLEISRLRAWGAEHAVPA